MTSFKTSIRSIGKCFLPILSSFFSSISAFGQLPPKEINHQTQAWLSLNSTVRLSNKWGFVADVHERRNHFLKDASFHFARVGANYWLTDKITITAGYAHLWLASSKLNKNEYLHENRIYQQAQMISTVNKITVLQRLRNEQRWQDKIEGGRIANEKRFSNRVRYLLSLTIPVSKDPYIPAIVLSDELCVQFGKEIIYNTFDQNRFFIGLRQKVSKKLSFDIGYMLLNQEKITGYQYDVNHTFRWFFYYVPDLRKKKS